MPTVLADCLEIAIEGIQPDGIFANVLHVDMSGTGEDLATTAQMVLDQYCINILPVLYSGVKVQQAHWTDLSSLSGATGVVVPGTGIDTEGGVTTAPAPPQVAYLIKLVGPSARGVRNGRMYLPGVRADELTDFGDVVIATRDNVSTAAQDFVSAVLGETGNPLSVLHRPGSGSPSQTTVTTAFCEPTVATQRRRLNR